MPAYPKVRDGILHYMWLGEPERSYTTAELAAEMEVSRFIARRELKFLEVDGLVSRIKGGLVHTRRRELAQVHETPSENDTKQRLRYLLAAREQPLINTTPDLWTITEEGVERVTQT